MSIFDGNDFDVLSGLFKSGYSGYRPYVVEAPNGDGNLDTQKRYLHIATKYNPPLWAMGYLLAAFDEAQRIAQELDIPRVYRPDLEACALRVLEYPPESSSAEHTDFDMFTFNAYRSSNDVVGATSDGVFIGELGSLIGLGPATPHCVPARDYVQCSIVFFALPAHDVVLPGGASVGEWLEERVSRSRYDLQ